LGPAAWRAAQPTPGQIKRWARGGLKTVVNLRGERMCGSYYLETAACREAGLALVNYQMRSRAAPSRAELIGAREVLNRIAYPALIHCKSGADRAGLMSVLYRHVREGWPIEKAVAELSLKFGHIRQANTGVLDHFFACYIAENKERPIDFYEWVETAYDPDTVKQSFQSKRWADRLVDGVLRRE
jgi:protein tyrosine/serine phosphatase